MRYPLSMSGNEARSPVALAAAVARSAWNTLLTVYYADSPSWRALKSGALVFFGLFLWAGSNLLLSYRPGLALLDYTKAYGALLVVYGPLHHAVVIPLALRWRRTSGARRRLGATLPNAGLAVFLVTVLLVGTAAPGAFTVDLASSLEDAGADIDPDLLCVKHTYENGTAEVHCHLADSRGVAAVGVESGDRTVAVDRSAPFAFTVRSTELDSVTGEKRFRVELLDGEGDLVRRYTRSLGMIDEE